MRLVVDTNILISALLAEASLPAHLIGLWRAGRFILLSSTFRIFGLGGSGHDPEDILVSDEPQGIVDCQDGASEWSRGGPSLLPE